MTRPLPLFLLLTLLTAVLFALTLLAGAIHIPVADVASILFGDSSGVKPSWRYIVLESRLPQAVTALLAGGSLSLSGLMLQTVFRNPLADPGIFGISGGAGLGVALVMLLLGGSIGTGSLAATGFAAVIVAAFIGAMAVMAVIFLFSTLVKDSVMLLIVGIMTGYMSSSAIALLNFFATDEGVKSYMVWGMGTFGGVSLSHLPVFAGVTVAGFAAAALMVKPLNTLLLGDAYAHNLGVSVRRVRNGLIIATGILTAVTTAFCGPVSFIGLAVPHAARMLFRTDDHRTLMPATLLCGAVTALLCNLICFLPGEYGVIPLGAVTPLIGAPVVVYIILRNRKIISW